jgi:molybdopterin synthase sulfur carrier subunit
MAVTVKLPTQLRGALRRFVNVYIGGEDIRFLDGLETPVSDGDELTILPAVAGG